jgi:hypothetical protein
MIHFENALRGYRALAKHLHICNETARKLMRKPGFPVVEVTSRIHIIPIELLEEWLLPKK